MFTGSFLVSQTGDFTSIVITDNSDYSSEGTNTFSGRKIYLYLVDGTTLVPAGTATSYIDFPYSAGNSITITGVLNKDYALAINVVCISLNPQPGSIYTLTSIDGFLYYLQAFESSLIGTLSGNPDKLRDTSWYYYLGVLQTELDNAIKSIANGQQQSAQNAINRATKLMDNQNDYF